LKLLNREIVAAAADPELREKLSIFGMSRSLGFAPLRIRATYAPACR
jgi:hypothetical protein